MNTTIKKKCIPSEIENSAIKFLKDVIDDTKFNMNTWDECQLHFELLSQIQRAIQRDNIDMLMQIEFVYRNEGTFTLHEQINDIINASYNQ